jgi:hypothetical protein
MSIYFRRLTMIALLLLILSGEISMASADNYTWKDSKGGWHVTNDREAIPPEILAKMDRNAGSRYQKYDDDSRLFYYRGFKNLNVAPALRSAMEIFCSRWISSIRARCIPEKRFSGRSSLAC